MLPTDEKQKNVISSISVMRSPEKVYKLFKNFKDLEFTLPIGWNDKYLALFVQSCRVHLDELKKTEQNDKERWHKIALFGAKMSENNSLFTINNCRKVAQSLKKYVLCNLNRMVNNEIFQAFYCDIKDLLEYFPSGSDIRLTRSTSSDKTPDYLTGSCNKKYLINKNDYFSNNKQINVKNQRSKRKSNSVDQKVVQTKRKINRTTMKKQHAVYVQEPVEFKLPVESNQNKTDGLNNAVKSEIRNSESSSSQENGLSLEDLSSMTSSTQHIENHDSKENINKELNEIDSKPTENNGGIISGRSVGQYHNQEKNTQCVYNVNFCIDPHATYGGHLEESNNDIENSNVGQNDDKDHLLPKESAIENSFSHIQIVENSAQNCVLQKNNNEIINPDQNEGNSINYSLSPSEGSSLKNSNIGGQFSDDKSRPFKKRGRSAMTNDVSSNSGLKFDACDSQVLSTDENNEVSNNSYNINSQKSNEMLSNCINSNGPPLNCNPKESTNSIKNSISNLSDIGRNSHPSLSPLPLKRKRGRPRKHKTDNHPKVEHLSPTDELKLFKENDNFHLSRSVKSDDKNRPLKKRGRYAYEEQANFVKKRIFESYSKSPKGNSYSEVIASLYDKDKKNLKKKKNLLHKVELNKNEAKRTLRKGNNGKKEVFKAEYCVNLEKSSITNLYPVVKLVDFIKYPSAIHRSQVKITEHTHNNENIKITDEETVTITLSAVNTKSLGEKKNVLKPLVTQNDHSRKITSTSRKRKMKSTCSKTNKKTSKSSNMKNKTRIRKTIKKKNDSSDSDQGEIDGTKKPKQLCQTDAIGSKSLNIYKNNPVSLNSKVSTKPSLDIKKSLHSNIVNTNNDCKEESSTSLSISQQLNLNNYNFEENGLEQVINNFLPNMSIKSLTELKEITALQANSPERARLVELITCSFEISHSMEKYDYKKPGWFGDYSKDFINWEICKVQGLVSNFEEQLKERNKHVNELEKIVENMDTTKSKSLSK